MDLCDKLSALLSLTSTKNNSIAKSINVDPSLISRLKNGTRKMPRDPQLLHSISRYLAAHIDNEYMVSALYDLTKDPRLLNRYDEDILENVINNWFTTESRFEKSEVSAFLSKLNSIDSTVPEKETQPFGTYGGQDIIRSYNGNQGKRQAVLEFTRHILSIDQPTTVKVFADESDSWMTEDSAFDAEFSRQIEKIVKRGFSIQRILPPPRSIDSNLLDVKRWIPAYITGRVNSYKYPWERDELHRRTIITVPGDSALLSKSVFGQNEAQTTIITNNKELVDEENRYFDSILIRCKRMIRIYTSNERSGVLKQLRNVSLMMNNGIYKSNRLSAHTMPLPVIHSLKKRASSYTSSVLDCYAQAETTKLAALEHHNIIDIISLPDVERVINGTEPVPGTVCNSETLYYTKEEYSRHLEHIIWYMENYPRYTAMIMDDADSDNLMFYTKGNEHALLIKETEPFYLLEISEPRISVAIVYYLKNIADKISTLTSRHDTTERLRRELERLSQCTKPASANTFAEGL